MPKYRFAVRSPEGKLRTGTVTEASIEKARDRLKAAGFLIVSLQEEAELVVLESKTPSGVKTPKTERAAIIEFETTFAERVGNFLNSYLLRKEVALVLLVAGGALAVYLNLSKAKPSAAFEEKYKDIKVEIQVETGGLTSKGKTYQVVLPDIPLRFSQPVIDGPLLKHEFEAVKQPGRVQVTLLDESNDPLAEGEGLLSIRNEGLLTASVPLSPIRKKTP